MRSLLQLSVISAVIGLALGQLDENEPTHIIKFKTSVSRAVGKPNQDNFIGLLLIVCIS